MLAEAFGADVKIASHGWHPWDLQIGDDNATYPDRIRIQVKNTALAQTWHTQRSNRSTPLFSLKYRKRPHHLEQDQTLTSCEPEGFLCEVFALYYHPKEVHEADHRDSEQWLVYLLPVIGSKCAVSEIEFAYLRQRVSENGKPSQTQRAPGTLERGMRGRAPIQPIPLQDLSIGDLIDCLAVSRS